MFALTKIVWHSSPGTKPERSLAIITITLTPKEAEALRIGIQSSDYHPRHGDPDDNPEITRPLVRAEGKLLKAIREAQSAESFKKASKGTSYQPPEYLSD